MRREGFERLYETHAQRLLAFLTYRTGDRQLAEDLLAETFERVLRSRKPFDPRRGSESTWLYTIALNCLRDHARRQAAEARALERVTPGAGGPSAPAAHDELERREMLARGLELLAPEEREAIALRFGADLTVPEIAKVTDEKLTTIEGRVYRALRKLRAALDEP